eukprot:1455642-Karenia_brevis.AAC.1
MVKHLSVQSTVIRSPLVMQELRLSDHGILRLHCAGINPKPLDQRPIPHWVTSDPLYHSMLANVCKSINLCGLSPVVQLEIFKQLMKETAVQAKCLLQQDVSHCMARHQLFITMARCIFHNNVAVAAVLLSRYSMCRMYMRIVHGHVHVVNPERFARDFDKISCENIEGQIRGASGEAESAIGSKKRKLQNKISQMARCLKLWVPTKKMLVLSGLVILPADHGETASICDEPISMASVLRSTWKGIFGASAVDSNACEQLLAAAPTPWDWSLARLMSPR